MKHIPVKMFDASLSNNQNVTEQNFITLFRGSLHMRYIQRYNIETED